MPGDVKVPLRNLAVLLVFFFVVFGLLVVIVLFVVFPVIVGRIGELKYGQRQRLAKEIAFIAHPHARNITLVDLHHAKRVAAGLQNYDIAWFQIHDLLLGLHDTNRILAIRHDNPIMRSWPLYLWWQRREN